MLIKLLTKLLRLIKTLTGSLLVSMAVGVQFTNLLICIGMLTIGPAAILELCSRLN